MDVEYKRIINHYIKEKIFVTNYSSYLKQKRRSILLFSKYFIIQIMSKEG